MKYPCVIEDFTGEYSITGDHRRYRQCPVCGDEKWHLYLNAVTGGWDCKKCGSVGRLKGFCGISAPKNGVFEWPEVSLPEWRRLTPDAWVYLRGRRLAHGATLLGYVETLHSRRIIVPYYDESSTCIYYAMRTYTGDSPKYLYPSGPKPLYVLGWNRSKAVIVEGVFDAYRVWKAGFMAVGIGGKTISRRQLKKLLTTCAECEKIWVLLDGDAGLDGAKLGGKIGLYMDVSIRRLPDGYDPADLTVEELQEVLE